MEEEGHKVNDYTNEDTDYTDDEDYNDEDYTSELETASKRQKRHTPEQIQELRAAFQRYDHPDQPTRRVLGAKIGLQARQVQYWFQNQRSQMQAKALVQNSKVFQHENAVLMAENVSLRQAILTKSCFTCGGATVPIELPAENRRLVMENARLRDENMRATALLNQILLSVPPAERPPVITSGRPAVLSASEGARRADRAARLRAHAEAAMDQFLLLATKGEPLWLPTPDGEVLSYLGYQNRALPVHHGFCPDDEFVMEATRETGMVRASAGAAYLVAILTDAKCWSEMFPSIVAGVTARSDAAIFSGNFGSRIQLMTAELLVQSPRLLNRRINFLRYTKPVAEGQWAVMDVSVDGILGPPGRRIIAEAAVANNTVVPASYTGWRLLPSGCLVEDMPNGYCKITWVVHAEYDETTVPTMFRPLFRSGKALGAHRWLASLRRKCEYLAALHSSQVPRNDNTAAAISSMGKRGILKLAQRMMAVFYSAVSGPVTQPSSNLYEWPESTGTGARSTDADVRMVTWKKAGSVADLVLSASTTVWLPNTPPQLVFQYLCDGQRRGEWDAFANGAAVTELCSVATGHLHGNAVSVLNSNVTDGIDSKKVLILQQACTDASCSMVVYAPVEEDSMRAVINSGDHASIFLLPSGFAVLPDGHGRARHAPSSSSAVVGRDNTAGSLLTVACQALLPGSSPSDNHVTAEAFDDVGKLLCRALKKIKAAVKANIVIPA
ncbi:homeobox-leucine zipper protein ROC6-like [Miscanthus floridulus]|uniref:homeobox-leucine zipper protein ROC6-like n=1 Tax=Miscanthus floridulus TaxID=154761 RepID=UPI00345AA66D